MMYERVSAGLQSLPTESPRYDMSLILNHDISWVYLYSFAVFMKRFLR